MKLTITHLKAPWPEGAKVGDVIDLPAVPTWAVGKCTQAADDADVTLGALAAVDAVITEADAEATQAAAALAEADAQAEQEKAALEAKATKAKPVKA